MYFDDPKIIRVKFEDEDLSAISHITKVFEEICAEMRSKNFNCLSNDDEIFTIEQIDEYAHRLDRVWSIVDSNAKIYHD